MPVWVLKNIDTGELRFLSAPAGRSPEPPEGWEFLGVATLALAYHVDAEEVEEVEG